jgi:hypothetical protein
MPSIRKHHPSLVAAERRHVHHRRVERDGIAQVLAVLDHGQQERLARGHVEGVDHALDHAERDEPADRDVPAQGEDRKGEGLQHRHGLCDDEQVVPVRAVNEDAREGPEHKRGKLTGKRDDTQEHGRAREAIHQPVGGGQRDPGAE